MIEQIKNTVRSLVVKTITFNLNTLDDDGRDIYLVGTFNDWNPQDERFKMERVKKGKYRLKVKLDENFPFPFEYKYTKGGWENEELTARGLKTKNRVALKCEGVIRTE